MSRLAGAGSATQDHAGRTTSSNSSANWLPVSRVNQNDALRVLCVSGDGRLQGAAIQTLARLQPWGTACLRARGPHSLGGEQ